ncbi:hypothetical protein [Prevotella sp.]|uniref:hypothetical protein n=1 Tax=Prevotella sp. TaxID=59823 RepID=UPI003DA6930C
MSSRASCTSQESFNPIYQSIKLLAIMTKNIIKSVNNDLFDQAYMEDLEERIETAPVAVRTQAQQQDFCSPICDFTCLVY